MVSLAIISSFINFITTLLLSVIVYFRNPSLKLNLSFSVFALDISLWSLSYYFWQISGNQNDAYVWSKILMIFAMYIPFFYMYFIFSLFEEFKKKYFTLFINFIILAVFLYINVFTNKIVQDVEPLLSFKYWPTAGDYFIYYLAYWGGYMVFDTYLIYRVYLKLTGLAKVQIKYVLIGLLFGIIGGFTNYFLWFKIPIEPFGNILVSVYVALTAYAIIRHRFLSVNLAIRKASQIIVSSMIIITTISSASYIDRVYFNNNLIDFKNIYFVVLVSFLTITVIPQVIIFSTKLLDKAYFGIHLNYQESLLKLAQQMTKMIDLSELSETMLKIITTSLGIKKAAILINDKSNNQLTKYRTVGFDDQKDLFLLEKNVLSQFLIKNKKIIVYEELDKTKKEIVNEDEKSLIAGIEMMMDVINARVVIPLLRADKLVAVIVLGDKKSMDAYSYEDLNLLEVIASQASVAIENALLYKEVNDFNHTLEVKVDAATHELKEAYSSLEKSYEDLKELDRLKDEFLSITSHELRTPMTIIKNYLWLSLKKIQITDEKLKGYLTNAYTATERMITLINHTLTVSRLESGKLKLEATEQKLLPLIEELINGFNSIAMSKNIKIQFENNIQDIEYRFDKDKIIEVITNLISNALKYTPTDGSGLITIKFEYLDGDVLISVMDNGPSITKEDIGKLFKKFSRLEESKNLPSDKTGTGLGLYISKKIVELHGGKIWAESEVGQGITFKFTIPKFIDPSVNVTN